MAMQSELVRLQETLYSSRNPTRRWLHTTRRDWVIDAIRRHAATGPTLSALEVGPGSGLYLRVLAELFDEVVASDVEEDYLRHASGVAEAHPCLRLVVDDITKTRLPASSFDLILCSEVVEHIRDSSAAIASMRRLLRPGGTLILTTPQRDSPLEIAGRVAFLPGIIDLVRLVYREPILKTGHINLMTDRQVAAQLTRAGFEVVETFKSGVYLPLVAEFTGTLGWRLERWLESKLRGGRLDRFLWTQYYVAQAQP